MLHYTVHVDNVENLILEHLRAVRGRLDQVADDVREIKGRLATVEATQGTLLQHMGHLASGIAQQQVSFDKLVDRIERIESRLELHS